MRKFRLQEYLDRRGFLRLAGRRGLGSLVLAEAAALLDRGGSAGSSVTPDSPGSGVTGGITRPWELSGGTLVASSGSQTIWPGSSTAVWTLGGAFPGPAIRVARGASFSARIENRLSEPTNVHGHGLASPPEMDGHPSDVIPPGQSRHIVQQGFWRRRVLHGSRPARTSPASRSATSSPSPHPRSGSGASRERGLLARSLSSSRGSCRPSRVGKRWSSRSSWAPGPMASVSRFDASPPCAHWSRPPVLTMVPAR